MLFDEEINLVIATDPFINVSGSTSFSQIDNIAVQVTEQPIIITFSDYYAPVQSVNGKIGFVVLTKEDLGITGGFITGESVQLPDTIIYTSGFQTISGLKDFTIRPTVNTIPVLLSGDAASSIEQYVKNDEGSIIYKGQPVYVNGSNGNNILIKLARNTGESSSSKTFGLLKQDLTVNQFGYVVTEGPLYQVNTSDANDGDPIWLGPTGNLIFGLINKPKAPNHLVYLGFVERAHQNQGKIFVKPQNGFEIDELHNVRIINPQHNDIIQYNSGSGLWLNSDVNFQNFATITNLASTGSTLNTRITNLSGYINSSDSNIVFTTGNQVISGNKDFYAEKYIFSGADVIISGGTFDFEMIPTTDGLNFQKSYISGELIKPNTGITLYNRLSNSREILTQVDSNGRSLAFQPGLGFNRIINYQPRSNSIGTANAGFGLNLLFSGAISRPIYMKVGDLLGSFPRIGFLHTSGNFTAGLSNNVDQNIFRGTGGMGGFFFQARFGISENNIETSGRGFFGLWDTQTVLVTNTIMNPFGTNRQNLIGVGFNSGDSNLSFIHADSTDPGTTDITRKKISLGPNFPIRSGNVYELTMYALPDKPYVDMKISILRSGIISGYRAINALPAPDYPLAPNFSVNGPSISGNIAFDLCSFYIDTPL